MMTTSGDEEIKLKTRDNVGAEDASHPVKHASDIIGDWGPLQRSVVLFYVLTYIIAAFQNVGITFVTPKLDFWCKRPPGYENATAQKCNSYEDMAKPCTEWEFDMSFYKSTATNEFSLVCEREWVISLSKSIYQIGYAVSSISVGLLSDKCGRLFALKWVIFLELFAGLWVAYSPNLYHFLAARFFLGIATYGRFLTGAILVMEVVGPKYRDTVRCLIEAGWCIGYLIMPWINYVVRDFRFLQLGMVGYESLFLVWLFRLPESPRWQLTHGKFADAEKTILRAAKMKGELTDEQVKGKLLQLKAFVDKEEETREEEAKKSIVDLWKVPVLRKFCLALYFIWFANIFMYYGFSYNAGVIGGSLHLNVFIHGIAETVIIVILYFTINKLPRKTYAQSLLVICGFATLAIIPFTFSEGGLPYRVALSTIGKLTISGVLVVQYIHSPEIFPTTLRHIGVGSCSLFGRIGSIFAPFAKELAEATHLSAMMVLIGGLSFINALVIRLLPETLNQEMPDTIEEAKNQMGKKKVVGQTRA